jgi:pimeloyl-ACP methyl ester carboxylesterase
MSAPLSHWFDGPRGPFHYLHWPGPAGAPTLHFAHANGFNANTYRTLLAPLAREFDVVAWDARGHGRTLATANAQEIGANWCLLRDDLAAFITHLDRPVVLAGHSLGAVLSTQLAVAQHPLVTGLVLMDPVFLPPLFLPLWGWLKQVGLPYLLPIARRARKRREVWPDRASILAAYTGRGGFRTWPDVTVLEDYLEAGTRELASGEVALSCAPHFEAAIFAATPHNIWRVLPEIRCPLTIVYGEKSDTFYPVAADRVRKLQPQARLVRIADATHFVPMEFPEPVRDELLRSLRAFPS